MRDFKRRTGGRSARVVQSAMEATLHELAERGYAALTLDAVAKRAGVNRTTLYRRWPAKVDLVRAAIIDVTKNELAASVEGATIQEELLAFVRRHRAVQTPLRRGVALALLSPPADDDLSAILQAVWSGVRNALASIVERGMARGELRRDTNPELVWRPVFAVMANEMLFREPTSDDFYAKFVSALLAGLAKSTARRRSPRSTTRKRRS